MTTPIAYTRVSTDGQTVEAQRHTIGERYTIAKWFTDAATSGATKALARDGFQALFSYVREGDTVVVVNRTGFCGGHFV